MKRIGMVAVGVMLFLASCNKDKIGFKPVDNSSTERISVRNDPPKSYTSTEKEENSPANERTGVRNDPVNPHFSTDRKIIGVRNDETVNPLQNSNRIGVRNDPVNPNLSTDRISVRNDEVVNPYSDPR